MKKPYQIRLEPEIIEKIKIKAKKEDVSVNHLIRKAIKNQFPDCI